MRSLTTFSRELSALDATTSLLKQRLIDHLVWMNQLSESAYTGKSFEGQLDYRKCNFGKWYYGLKLSPDYAAMSPDYKTIFDKMEPQHERLHRSAKKINDAGSTEAAIAIFRDETSPAVAELQKNFNEYIVLNESRGRELNDRFAVMSSFETGLIIALTLITVFFVGISIFWLTRKIFTSMKKLENSIYQLSRGDLVIPMETVMLNCSEVRKCGKTDCAMYDKFNNSCFIAVGSYAPLVKNEIACPAIIKGKFKDCRECPVMKTIAPDEFSFMEVLIDHFRQKLQKVLNDVTNMIFSLVSASSEVSKTAVALADSSQYQAASAEEITATVEEISAAMDGIATSSSEEYTNISSLLEQIKSLSVIIFEMGQKTRETASLAQSISIQASTGSKSLEDMNESIMKIGASSGEVKNIIGIINDISDKINLLSLNAAIEAARAGEAGRGFAVVADEISKLADQTAQSIKGISDLIQENDSEISRGTESVRTSVEILSQIISGVNVISDFISSVSETMKKEMELGETVGINAGTIKKRSDEIRIAMDEQKIAFTEITKSISNINITTQTNASSSEELASNSEEITGLTEIVKKEVEFFKLS